MNARDPSEANMDMRALYFALDGLVREVRDEFVQIPPDVNLCLLLADIALNRARKNET